MSQLTESCHRWSHSALSDIDKGCAIILLMHNLDTPHFLLSVRFCYFSLWIASPLRSLGSNQVVFGGMIFPESAMSTSCFIDTG